MLAAIQQGQGQLKKVDTSAPAPATPPKNDLMSSILTAKLRKVSDNERPENKPPPSAAPATLNDGNIASILARRIAIIGEAGEESSDSAGSEWDDDD